MTSLTNGTIAWPIKIIKITREEIPSADGPVKDVSDRNNNVHKERPTEESTKAIKSRKILVLDDTEANEDDVQRAEDGQVLSEYELIRLRNIEERRNMFASLRQEVKDLVPKKPTARPSRVQKKKALDVLPVVRRKSSRNIKKAETDTESLKELDEYLSREKRRGN